MNKTAIFLTLASLSIGAYGSQPSAKLATPNRYSKIDIRKFQQSSADADWKVIQDDYSRDKINAKLSRMTSIEESSLANWRWESAHLLAYRNDGLAFWDHYPNDPRRYEWLVRTVCFDKDLHYFKNVEEGVQGLLAFYKDHKPFTAAIDDAAKAAWQARYPDLKESLLASPQATEEQKCQISAYDIAVRMDSAAWAVRRGEKPDLSDIEADILRYAVKYPAIRTKFPALTREFGGYYPENFARGLIMSKPLPNEFLLDRAQVPSFLKRLMASSNHDLVTFAVAESHINELRSTPLDLHFAAMDGRAVNLEKLRGKVVLVEFSAVTWCGACQHMRPVLKDLYAKYHDQGVEIVTILLDADKDKDKVAGVLKTEGDQWPHWLTGSMKGNEFTKKLGVDGVPYILFLDKDGLLAYDVPGWNPNSEAMDDTLIRRLLAQTAQASQNDWGTVAALLDSGPPPIPQDTPKPGEDSAQYEVRILTPLLTYRRQLRDAGLRFYHSHPNDPRRWLWFVPKIKNPTSYYSNVALGIAASHSKHPELVQIDQDAKSGWARELPSIRAAFLASNEVTPDMKAEFTLQELTQLDYKLRKQSAAGQKVDGSEFLSQLDTFARTYQNSPLPQLILASTMGDTRGLNLDSATVSSFKDNLKKSPNEAVRRWVLNEEPAALATARIAPLSMQFTAIDGRQVNLESMRGKVVLIDFWATWCGPCKAELPKIKALYQKYHDEGLEVVGISLENAGDRSKLAAYASENGLSWPQYYDGKYWQNEYALKFGIQAIPALLVLNKQGILVAGPSGLGENLEPILRKSLGLAAEQ